MSKKIEIVGSALVVTDTESGLIELTQPPVRTWYKEEDLQIGRISFYDLDGTDQTGGTFDPINLSEAVNSADASFTESTFRTFAQGNLGFNSALGGSGASLNNRVIVTQLNKDTTLGGVINSDKQYFLDGIIDLGTTSIEVPSGGISLRGYNLEISGLTSSENSYTMFTSPVGGSGDFLAVDLLFEVTGTSSKIYDLVADTGAEAHEVSRINYNNCTSLGEINGYRQGLETGTGRFGGTPNLILSGTWLGGYFIETSIVRDLTDGSYALYEEGTSFTMTSRFRSNQNLDLNTTVAFFNFDLANFPNTNTIQLDSCIITRNGVLDPTDTTIIPNIGKGDLASLWRDNTGIENTHIGGELDLTTGATTSITVLNQFETISGAWTASFLQHFDNPSNGQLRHIASVPRECSFNAHLTLDGTAGDILIIRVRKWDDSASSFVTELTQTKEISNFTGPNDTANYNFIRNKITLDQNDYVFLECANTSSSSNDVTLEEGSYFIIEER